MTWMKFYYANPTPERFAPELRAVAQSGSLENPATRIAVGTFFGLVMRANPTRVSGWTAELADLRGAARETLHLAAWMSGTNEGRAFLEKDGADKQMLSAAPDLLNIKVDDPTALDLLWAYYFATGDARAVRRIISALEYLSDFGAAAKFKTTAKTEEDRRRAMNDALFQAASWSLTSLMQEHKPLRALCEQLLDEKDLTPNEWISLALTLQKVDPDTWDVQIDPATGTSRINRKVVAPKR